MGKHRAEDEFREFYECWAPALTAFCRLYLGDSRAADAVTTNSFMSYFRRELPLRLDHLPTALVTEALEESASAGEGGGGDVDSEFEWAVLGLEPVERAVFILHGVLELQMPWIAAISQISFEAVNQLWVRALLDLRMAMVRDSCSRLFSECGVPVDSGPIGAASA